MEVVEKKLTVILGINKAARKLKVSRGHLSLVMHGKRQSKRLASRINKEFGIQPAAEVAV